MEFIEIRNYIVNAKQIIQEYPHTIYLVTFRNQGHQIVALIFDGLNTQALIYLPDRYTLFSQKRIKLPIDILPLLLEAGARIQWKNDIIEIKSGVTLTPIISQIPISQTQLTKEEHRIIDRIINRLTHGQYTPITEGVDSEYVLI